MAKLTFLYTVPIFFLSFSECSIFSLAPKSIIFRLAPYSLESKRIFSGFKSLWTIPIEWQYAIAESICFMYEAISFSVKI